MLKRKKIGRELEMERMDPEARGQEKDFRLCNLKKTEASLAGGS